MTAQDDPYVRVYYRALTDEKFRTLSSDAWGHWVRLLVIADGMYPASAPLPRWAKSGPLKELTAARIVSVEGEYFRIVGMEPERSRRSEAATFAADVKHHGVAEAERRRSERSAVASGRITPHVRNDAPQRNGRAEPASPLLSSPSLSTPLHSAPSREQEPLTDKATDDETALCLLAEQLSGTPYGLQLHSAMGQKAKAMLAKHGPAAVEREWRRITAEERGMPTVRQLVLGADNALNRVSSPAPASPADRKAEVADFVERMNREAAEARKGMPRAS